MGGAPNRRLGRAEQELLEDVPHRQVVFTIPKRLRVFFRYDRKLLGELAGCAWRALKLYFEAYFDGAVVDNLLSWRHSGSSAHGAVCVQDREGAVRLGRYMIRCPIVIERLAWDEGAGQVVCRSRPTRRSSPFPAEARWDVLEFLARVIDHIPEPSQQTVRYSAT